MNQAPLFVRGYDLYAWLLQRMEKAHGYRSHRRAVIHHTRQLLESISLALQGFDPGGQVENADRAAALLRLHLRVCEELKLLEPSQYRHAMETLEDMGRQIGGWRKKLAGRAS